ncbi:Gag-Pro-Pol polyprotein [Labeo rohita]|uniref:ribonuclease H n=1 Tax=Labeo rohita TaxID=84645 RepID=A0ABQ8N0B3_LABRO|nr:Gag-Pro-Pol polyprotein [Labeo rohita]
MPGAEVDVFYVKPVVNTGSTLLAPTQPVAVIANKIKHRHSQKESKFPLPIMTGVSCHHDGQLPEPIIPLATRAEAWQAIPGVSDWVMGIIKRGYSLQFARRPPCFSGVVPTVVMSRDAHVLRSEVLILLEKGAIEVVHPAQSESGFYSRYFLVPKKDGGDWFLSLDLKDAYFHIQIAPHHRRFLRFAFEGVAYQYTVLPFGLSLAPRTFTKCMDAALVPLRQKGIRVLNYLDDWLILAQSEAVLISHRALLLSHLECLGLRVNLTKSTLHRSRQISFLGAIFDSTQLRAMVVPERALTIRQLAGSFRVGALYPLKRFQRMLGVMASASPVLELGLLRMRPLQRWLKPRGGPGMCGSPGPLEKPTLVGEGRALRVGLLKEGGHDRRLQQGLGGAVRRQPSFRPMVESGGRVSHQLPGNAGSMSRPSLIPARPEGTPCTDPLGQHDCGVLHKSSGGSLLQTPLHPGEGPSGMGSAQPGLTESGSRTGQTEPRGGYAITKQCPLRRMDDSPTDGSENLGSLWQGRGRPLRLKRQLSLPNILFEGQRCVGPRLAQPPPVCLSPDILDSSGTQASQGTEAQAHSGGPSLEEPAMVVRAVPAALCSPLADPPEAGPPLSGERDNMAPPARSVGLTPLVSGRESENLPEGVLNTISQARAPSTRHLYALKWSVFSTWCSTHGKNPASCDISVILSFLQELLDKGRSPSTLKVYVAAIAAFHAPIADQSIGRNNLVVRFLKGSRRMNPSRPHTIPTWDLSTVLGALKSPPFEPLSDADLKPLTLKTALLLALVSVKRIGDLQALSISPSCLEFGPGDSKVILKPRHGYVPKVPSTPFRVQVVTLSALPSSEGNQELSLLCPVRPFSPWYGVYGSVPIASKRRSTSVVSIGNVLGYCHNLGSLRYGNEYCVTSHTMSLHDLVVASVEARAAPLPRHWFVSFLCTIQWPCSFTALLKKASVKEKKGLFPIASKRRSTRSRISGNRGYDKEDYSEKCLVPTVTFSGSKALIMGCMAAEVFSTRFNKQTQSSQTEADRLPMESANTASFSKQEKRDGHLKKATQNKTIRAHVAIWVWALVMRPKIDLSRITQCIGLDLDPCTWSRMRLQSISSLPCVTRKTGRDGLIDI